MSFITWAVAAPPLAMLAIYSLEVVFGLRPLATRASECEPNIAVLIPAHDEAAGIGETLSLLGKQATPSTRILVVADNCTDATAEMARAAGAEVAERVDPDRRGKGYALAFGRDRLAADPPDVVVVLDADCRFMPQSLPALAAAATQGPAQAVNLMMEDLAGTPMVQISSFAVMVKNLVRGRATSRLGGAALLTGTGMAFPWNVFATAPLATGHIVEDLALGIELARAGARARLIEAAQVRSAPAAQADARSQRSRWEHGFLATALRQAPSLIAQSVLRGDRALLFLGLHLLVPPLSLLFMMALAALLAVTVLATTTSNWVPVIALAGGLAGGAFLTLVAWWREGRGYLAPLTLLRLPLYAMWKIPIYARFFVRRETDWRRTPRAAEEERGS